MSSASTAVPVDPQRLAGGTAAGMARSCSVPRWTPLPTTRAALDGLSGAAIVDKSGWTWRLRIP